MRVLVICFVMSILACSVFAETVNFTVKDQNALQQLMDRHNFGRGTLLTKQEVLDRVTQQFWDRQLDSEMAMIEERVRPYVNIYKSLTPSAQAEILSTFNRRDGDRLKALAKQ